MTTPENTAKVTVRESGIDVALTATLQEDGSVKCKLDCNNQSVKITFDGTDVVTDVASD
jgi:hypothetical protein